MHYSTVVIYWKVLCLLVPGYLIWALVVGLSKLTIVIFLSLLGINFLHLFTQKLTILHCPPGTNHTQFIDHRKLTILRICYYKQTIPPGRGIVQ